MSDDDLTAGRAAPRALKARAARKAKPPTDAPDKRATKEGDDDFFSVMRSRAERARMFDQLNITEAISDLRFAAGDQWPADIRAQREKDGRPCLTINETMQFVRQVTGDMRQARPAIKCYGVDDHADRKTAEVMEEVIRYIENRSDARAGYAAAVDSQVIAGIGHLIVSTEYSDGGMVRSKVAEAKDRRQDDAEGERQDDAEERREQDIRISIAPDQVSVLWDPDSVMPGRVDADWCFVPVDYEWKAFKEAFPDSTAASFDAISSYLSGLSYTDYWTVNNRIRVADYYVKNYGDDGKPPSVTRYRVTAREVLEEVEIPSALIPVIPVIGEEIRAERSVLRFGKVRHLRPVQMAYNYWVTAQTELVALQPKAPFIGTEKNFEANPEWWTANTQNHPFLAYTPDPLNGNVPPQRSQPPVASPGFEQAIQRMQASMRSVSGIYDAALGAKSNEISGKAILARQREGDTGTFVYMDNFTRALTQLGRVLVSMIPRVYDTERTLRIIGEDGAVNEVTINKAQATPNSILDGAPKIYANDLTVGKYDVMVDVGPAYSTARDEARDGMMQLLQSFPQAAPAIADLVASAQNWPQADKVAKRLRMLAPPAIQQAEAQEAGPDAEPPPPPPPPSPQEQMQMQAQQAGMQAELQLKQAEAELKAAQAMKAKAEAMKAEVEAKAALVAPLVAPQAPQSASPDHGARMDMIEAALGELAQQIAAALSITHAPPPQPEPGPPMPPPAGPPPELMDAGAAGAGA